MKPLVSRMLGRQYYVKVKVVNVIQRLAIESEGYEPRQRTKVTGVDIKTQLNLSIGSNTV
jgi:hypothetical protein